jgi:hypothetical protein
MESQLRWILRSAMTSFVKSRKMKTKSSKYRLFGEVIKLEKE